MYIEKHLKLDFTYNGLWVLFMDKCISEDIQKCITNVKGGGRVIKLTKPKLITCVWMVIYWCPKLIRNKFTRFKQYNMEMNQYLTSYFTLNRFHLLVSDSVAFSIPLSFISLFFILMFISNYLHKILHICSLLPGSPSGIHFIHSFNRAVSLRLRSFSQEKPENKKHS